MTSNNSIKDIKEITDLTPDPQNANKGTERGFYVLDDSLDECGAGRSVLVDKDGALIAGNKTVERAADKGYPVRVVQTDGTELVVVQRTDLDLGGDGDEAERARKLAYYDNRSGQLGLDWDTEQVLADLKDGVDLSGLWRDDELDELLAIVPDFQTVGIDEQPRLDQKKPVECPECGHEFQPS